MAPERGYTLAEAYALWRTHASGDGTHQPVDEREPDDGDEPALVDSSDEE
jgi:hypothetical protein